MLNKIQMITTMVLMIRMISYTGYLNDETSRENKDTNPVVRFQSLAEEGDREQTAPDDRGAPGFQGH